MGTSLRGMKADSSASLISPVRTAEETPTPRLFSILLYSKLTLLGGEMMLMPSLAHWEMLTLDTRGDLITL